SVNEIYTGTVIVTSNTEMDTLSSSASVAGDEIDPNVFNNVQTLVLPSINPLVATPSPMIVTATPLIITSVAPVQVVATQSSVATTSNPAGRDAEPAVPDNNDPTHSDS